MNWGKKNSNLNALLVKTEAAPSRIPVAFSPFHKIKLGNPNIRCGRSKEETQVIFVEKREGLLLRAKEV